MIYCLKHKTSVVKGNFSSAAYMRQEGKQTAGKPSANEGEGWILPCWTSAPPQPVPDKRNAQHRARLAEGRKDKMWPFRGTSLLEHCSQLYMNLSTSLPR